MPYYCKNCKKYHADGYNAHLKYKVEPPAPNNNDLLKRLRKVEQTSKKQQKTINLILKVLKTWSPVFSRKFPDFQRKALAQWLEAI